MGRNCLPIYRPTTRSIATNYKFETSPRTEARALLPLLRLPRESIATVRSLIDVSLEEEKELRRDEVHAQTIINFRRRVLDHFEVLTGLKPELELKPTPELVPVVKMRTPTPRKFDHDAILAAVRDGVRTAEIVRRFGCCRATVRAICRKNGVEPKRQRQTRIPAEKMADAFRAHETGMSWRKVAAKLGVCFRTLVRHREMYAGGAAHGANI